MNTTTIIVAAVLLLLAIFITRLVFSIPAILRNLKAMVTLLANIAVKSGVDIKEVKAILERAEGERNIDD